MTEQPIVTPPPRPGTPAPPKGPQCQYHNYAYVCHKDSRIHTEFCMKLPRGYSCSGNGYIVQNHMATTTYDRCVTECECLNIGPKPVCLFRVDGSARVCHDEVKQ